MLKSQIKPFDARMLCTETSCLTGSGEEEYFKWCQGRIQ